MGIIAAGVMWFALHTSKNITYLSNEGTNKDYQNKRFENIEDRVDYLEKKVSDSINNKKELIPSDDPWYLKYLLPSTLTLLIGIISFFLSQLLIRYLEKNKSREKYVGNLKIILEEIKRNLDLECQLHAYLYVQILPTFSLSFFITEKIFAELAEVCINYDLLKKIFHKYFEFRHIQNRIDKTITKARELEEVLKNEPNNFRKIQMAGDIYDSERLGTILLIHGNIVGTYELYNSIIKEINGLEKNNLIEYLPKDYLEMKFYEYQNDLETNSAAKTNQININERKNFYKN
jgi:hypothetical protein